jgi:hypothetical protein
MLDMAFVAAVLEGIESTLDELIGRVERSDLRGRLTTLQDETAAARNLFEASATAGTEGDEPAVSWGHVEH